MQTRLHFETPLGRLGIRRTDLGLSVHCRRILVLFLCAIAAALPSCQPRAAKPNVILIVIDTLRADRLGVYGNGRGLTPFLDELAGRGVVFKNAYATSSWTVPSVSSLFTSRFPSQHHMDTYDSKLPDGEVTLAEVLAAADYTTGGVQANFRLNRQLGYAQGFRDWMVLMVPDLKVRGARVRSEALAWLRGERPSEPSSAQSAGGFGLGAPTEPLLLYLQYMEPHAPYQPPQPYHDRFVRPAAGIDEASANAMMRTLNFKAFTPAHVDLLESLYDGEVASVDAELRALFAALEEDGILKNAVIVVTADHGEEFDEHGRMAHGLALYNETIRVPLIIVAPGIRPGTVIDLNVSLIDVAPTILELAGLPPQASFEGHSLVPMITARSAREWLAAREEPLPDVISELPPNSPKIDLRAHSRALVRGVDKLLIGLHGPQRREEPEVYDLSSDPHETVPLPPTEKSATLEAALRERTDALAMRAGVGKEVGFVDDGTKEKLRALGYQD
jgi:arylsulfatase A-like enzyme